VFSLSVLDVLQVENEWIGVLAPGKKFQIADCGLTKYVIFLCWWAMLPLNPLYLHQNPCDGFSETDAQ